MITKIDWFSFSFEMPANKIRQELDILNTTRTAIARLHPDLPDMLAFDSGFTAGKGRAPYAVGWKHASDGYTLYTNTATPHALIEITGRGCDFLADPTVLQSLLKATTNRITRLDIAQDILCDTLPLEFTDQRKTGRFKSHSQAVSSTGSTSYIGSRSSDRYCRVYRYNPPHPRHAFLRIEYSVKAENAILTATSILETSLEATGAALGDAFGWKHPIYRNEAPDAAELAVWRPERREGKTVFWLHDTIGPLVARLHNEGLINVYEWLQSSVIPRMILTDDDE
jgi:hypothetical protein